MTPLCIAEPCADMKYDTFIGPYFERTDQPGILSFALPVSDDGRLGVGLRFQLE